MDVAWPLVLPGLGFMTAGLPMIVLAVLTMRKDRAIARWPTTQGVISSSAMDTATGSEQDDSGHTTTYETYKARVQYTYTVADRVYEGSEIARVGMWTTDRARVAKTLARYAPGAEVTVLYDPQNPAVAYLEVRHSFGALFLLVFGLVFDTLGTFLFVLSFVV